MAEFCVQCAEKMGFPKTDFKKLEEGYVISVICEGCGSTIVDHKGRCVADCLEHHDNQYVKDYDKIGWARRKEDGN